MSEDQGYSGNALDCLKKHNAKVGYSIKITADLTYSGILMPRYESGDDKHLVVKLGNGYNVGIDVDEIQNIEIVSSSEVKPKQDKEIAKIEKSAENAKVTMKHFEDAAKKVREQKDLKISQKVELSAFR